MRFAWIAALGLLSSAQASARPYSVSDLLSLESYGRAIFSPSGRSVVVERLSGYDRAARYTYDYFQGRARSRVKVATVAGLSGLRLLFPQERGAGYWLGGFSPSGRKLAVYRLRDDRISIGIVDMQLRRVSWLPVTPDLPAGRVNPTWLDERRIVLVTLPRGNLPLPLDFGAREQRRLPPLWESTAKGQVAARTVVGSGMDLQAGVVSTRRSLVVVDTVSSSVRRLAVGDFIDFSVSPDRRNIAVIERGAAVPAPTASKPLSLDFQSRRFRLRVVDLAGRGFDPCLDCDLAPDLLSWSASGRRLLFYSRQGNGAWEDGRLGLIDVADHRYSALPTGPVAPSVIRTTPGRATVSAGWVGERPVVFGRSGAERPDWFDVSGQPAVSLTGGVAADVPSAVNANGGSLCGISAGVVWSVSPGRPLRTVSSVGRTVVMPDSATAYDIGTRATFDPVRKGDILLRHPKEFGDELISVACNGTGTRSIGTAPQDARVMGIARGPRTALVTRLSQSGETTLSLVGVGARIIDTVNKRLASISPSPAIPLRRGAGGRSVVDWLLLPADPKPGRALPMVVIPYPGLIYGERPPADFGVADYEPALSPQLLAAHGYAVLAPSMPIGAGEPVEDIMGAITPAIGAAIRTGRIDPSRIGVLGHSYGGYTALMMATEMPCLRTAVASASISDLLMMYGTFDPRVKGEFKEGLPTTYPFAWAEDGQGRMEVPPWRDPELYLRNSPFYRLDRATAPILLLHGDLDPLSVGQAERTFAALYRLGKDARLVRYYGEGHVPVSPATIRDRWAETLSWLKRTMAPDGPHPGGVFDGNGACRALGP